MLSHISYIYSFPIHCVFICVFKTLKITEGFTTFLTFIWLLFIFLVLIWFMSIMMPNMPIKGQMMHKDFSTCTAFIWFHSSSFLVYTEFWNKAVVSCTLTTLFTCIESHDSCKKWGSHE